MKHKVLLPIGTLDNELNFLHDSKTNMELFSHLAVNSKLSEENNVYICPRSNINKTQMSNTIFFGCTSRQTISNRIQALIDKRYLEYDHDKNQFILDYNNFVFLSIDRKIYDKIVELYTNTNNKVPFLKFYLYLKYRHQKNQHLMTRTEILENVGVLDSKAKGFDFLKIALESFNENDLIKIKFYRDNLDILNFFDDNEEEIKTINAHQKTASPVKRKKKDKNKILAKAYIYAIIIDNQLGYIGITTRDIKTRMGEHLKMALTDLGKHRKLYEALKKGEYFFEIWEEYHYEITLLELQQKEKELIEELRPLYNTIGIDKPYIISE